MTQLLDVFGYLSVLLRGGALAASALLLGGIVFVSWACPVTKEALGSCRRLLCWSAAAVAAVETSCLATGTAVLQATAGLPLREAAGANYFLAGMAAVCAAAAAGLIVRRRERPRWALWIPGAVILGALVSTSHAAGRVDGRPVLLALTMLHQGAAAVWIGGLPYLLLALAHSAGRLPSADLCRRFSRFAMGAVAVLAASGAGLSLVYVGRPAALYGTSYGAMVATKAVLLGLVLIPGALNHGIVRQCPAVCARLLPRLRRYAEAEVGIGFTVILAAASLTSQPPAVDQPSARVTAHEIADRMSPRAPTLRTPPLSSLSPATPLEFDSGAQSGLASFVPGAVYHPNTPDDIAWSEYNHHWSGLIVLAAGLLAVMARAGVRWARHWPLAFLGLAVFLFLRSDPENWPLGPRSFWQSFAVAEVLQHRVFVLLVVAFAGFEWAVRTGRIPAGRASLVFPMVCAAGGALLLTHSHTLGNIKEELLAELSHIPLAILAVIAGWSRWLEVRLPPPQRRALAWVWPVCFVLLGAVLLTYRES